MKPSRTCLVFAAILLALPFWGLLAIFPLSWMAQRLPDSRLLNSIVAPLFAPAFYGLIALAHPIRYVVISLAAIAVALAALVALIAAHRTRIWRRPAFYLCLAALAAVIAFPWTRSPYEPALQASNGAALRLVNRPVGLLAGVVRSLQAGAEFRPEMFEPLGWADNQTLVYRVRRGAGYDRTGAWQEGTPGPALAYDLATDASRPWDGALDGLYRAPCPHSGCARSLVAGYNPDYNIDPFLGHYADALPSPDGRWFALVSRHIYGPEDVVIVSAAP